MTENEALEMCSKINQEKQVILEDMIEAIINKLETARDNHYEEMKKEEQETDFYSSHIVDEERGCMLGLDEAINVVVRCRLYAYGV